MRKGEKEAGARAPASRGRRTRSRYGPRVQGTPSLAKLWAATRRRVPAIAALEPSQRGWPCSWGCLTRRLGALGKKRGKEICRREVDADSLSFDKQPRLMFLGDEAFGAPTFPRIGPAMNARNIHADDLGYARAPAKFFDDQFCGGPHASHELRYSQSIVKRDCEFGN